MSVTTTEWVDLVQSEYLMDFIVSGGAAVKVAVALPQQTEALLTAIGEKAQSQGYLVARVNAAQTRIHMIDQVFYAVARQVDWDAMTDRWLRARFAENGIHVEEGQSLHDIDALATANDRLERDLYGQINRLITNALLKDYAMCKEFRTAAAMLCQGYLNPQNVPPMDAEVVKQWLHGEKCNLTALKRLQIYQKIGRHNARLLLDSLAVWTRKAGYSGLTLLIDLSAVVEDTAPGVNPVRYTRSTVLDAYELLRQFIDDTDETSNLFLVTVAGPGLLNDPKRSIDNYDALKLRISNEVRDLNRANPLNAMVRFDVADDQQSYRREMGGGVSC